VIVFVCAFVCELVAFVLVVPVMASKTGCRCSKREETRLPSWLASAVAVVVDSMYSTVAALAIAAAAAGVSTS